MHDTVAVGIVLGRVNEVRYLRRIHARRERQKVVSLPGLSRQRHVGAERGFVERCTSHPPVQTAESISYPGRGIEQNVIAGTAHQKLKILPRGAQAIKRRAWNGNTQIQPCERIIDSGSAGVIPGRFGGAAVECSARQGRRRDGLKVSTAVHDGVTDRGLLGAEIVIRYPRYRSAGDPKIEPVNRSVNGVSAGVVEGRDSAAGSSLRHYDLRMSGRIQNGSVEPIRICCLPFVRTALCVIKPRRVPRARREVERCSLDQGVNADGVAAAVCPERLGLQYQHGIAVAGCREVAETAGG